MASLTKPTLQNANITQRLIFNNFDSKSSFLLSRLEPFRASFAGNVNIHRNVYRQVDGLLLRALGVDSRAIFGRECSWEYFGMWGGAVESDKPHYYEHDRRPFQISSLRVPIPPQSTYGATCHLCHVHKNVYGCWSGPNGIPEIPGSRDFQSIKIPGFFNMKSRDFSGSACRV